VIVVDHTSDNSTVTFRFKHAEVKMLAAKRTHRRACSAPGVHHPNADRAQSSRR
jgi:hypothetical protein